MGVELLEKLDKFSELVKARRFGVVWVYLSIATLLITATAALSNIFTTLDVLILDFTSNLPSLVSGLILAGPVLAFFMLWIWVRPNDSGILSFEDDQALEQLLEACLPRTLDKARFIQYSGDKSDAFMRLLLKRGAKVDLLLKHPATEELDVQKKKMRLLEPRWRDYPNPEDVQIRFYKEQASVRGVAVDGKVLGLSWYTYQQRGEAAPEPWLFGHSNLHIGFPCNSSAGTESEFFDNLFNTLWKNAQPMWIEASGRISKGHGVAGSKSEHYSAGTIKLQTEYFREQGVDISPYHPATLNIDISPLRIDLVRDAATGSPVTKTLPDVNWTDNHPPETFSFSDCWLTYREQRYPGLIYYPHPKTKVRHEQNPGIVEVLCTKIPLVEGESNIEIQFNSLEVDLFR
ncbi:hypothetical protein RI844_03060 [Thalassotalea fonticola]|uniref:Uncharacterized protein n=1 Tax=Thalassotalea fonticola TaxID=3065649 RepID=A0ABZ0GQK3_9GAMM|nr:hypothetical protein RI844_03060 [Colwelliaceae bacterium S1-1]